MDTPRRTRTYRSHHLDSERWDHVTLRPGDVELTYSLLDAAGGAHGPMPRCPATERELWADWMTRSLFDWETDGWPFWSHHHHAASFWPYRDLPNVLMVHYADLLADLEAQMRRVAAFTQLDVAEDAWPELVAAARFDAMKQEAMRNEEYIGTIFEGGAGRFFHRAPTDVGATSSPRRTWPSTSRRPRSSTRSCAYGSKPVPPRRDSGA